MIVKIELKKQFYMKGYKKMNLPMFFKPIFKGKRVVAFKVKFIKNKTKEEIKTILEEYGLWERIKNIIIL